MGNLPRRASCFPVPYRTAWELWRGGQCFYKTAALRRGDRRRRCAVTIPASAIKLAHGTSRGEWWPRSSGTLASFIPASGSSSAPGAVGRARRRLLQPPRHREQCIKEGKVAVKWTRLSCRTFAANAVRLQLHALAYNLGNFMRTLAMPKTAEPWSLTSLREKLIKIGAKVVSHGRYVTFQMAEVAVPRQMFARNPVADRPAAGAASAGMTGDRSDATDDDGRGAP